MTDTQKPCQPERDTARAVQCCFRCYHCNPPSGACGCDQGEGARLLLLVSLEETDGAGEGTLEPFTSSRTIVTPGRVEGVVRMTIQGFLGLSTLTDI